MPPTLIVQGLTARTHAAGIAELLDVGGIDRIIVSVAFASSAGVQIVADTLRPHASKTTVFAGIRNEITSAQAVRALLDLGVTVNTVDTGSLRVLFHPKLYLARGPSKARLLVGSANLTTGGLNDNVEASLVVDLDLSSEDDRKLVEHVEKLFLDLTTQHPENVATVPPGTSLTDLLADPRFNDERATAARIMSKLAGGAKALKPVPLLKLLTTRIASGLSKKKGLSPPASPPASGPTHAPPAVSYEWMWSTTELKERDLNVPKGSTTNATGSVNLDKGGMEDGFDFKNYFRDEVFDKLSWNPPDARNVETATGNFRIIVEGIDCGEFPLTVRHSTKLPQASRDQNQPQTRLSWGNAKPFVARSELIGRSLRLSRATDNPTRFLIEID